VSSIDAAFIDAFTRRIHAVAAQLLTIDDDAAARPTAPGKWSRKEIIGHLIDSATNNHARFVRALTSDDLVFEGYDQEAWVRLQRYNERGWADLVALWRDYNLHIASIMSAADRDALDRPHSHHSLDRIAFVPVATSEPATLAYLMRDYIAHLEHHLDQIFS
jgi:hypothetical protein